jgi:hypothetical protein
MGSALQSLPLSHCTLPFLLSVCIYYLSNFILFHAYNNRVPDIRPTDYNGLNFLQEYQSKIDRLQAELQAVRDKEGAVYLPQDMYDAQNQKLESQEEEIRCRCY